MGNNIALALLFSNTPLLYNGLRCVTGISKQKLSQTGEASPLPHRVREHSNLSRKKAVPPSAISKLFEGEVRGRTMWEADLSDGSCG